MATSTKQVKVNTAAKQMSAELSDKLDHTELLRVLKAFEKGDFSQRMSAIYTGTAGKIADTLNNVIETNAQITQELERVSDIVGKEGQISQRAKFISTSGSWSTYIDSVNTLIDDLIHPAVEVGRVIQSVAKGDLTQSMGYEIEGRPIKGAFLERAQIVNTMVDQLSTFASEVTRVAREVGTEGKLGGQAEVRGVGGTWKGLTDSVNMMANNLTSQVRNIAEVTTAVATGDLSKKITVDVKGEILELKNTVNTMVDQISSFASEVTRVAREVGTEGKLGGQADVKDVAGTWKDLTDNVNRLAANLTNQVRAIAEVATAVTKGDLSRSITVEAAGEVAALKDNINEMIRNLRDTTRINTEQDWLKTNLTRFTRLLQGQRDLGTVSRLILSELAPLVNMQHGVFYLNEPDEEEQLPLFKLFASYAYTERKHISNHFHLREGLVGQCAFEKQRILLTGIPADYIKISSGLGEAAPLNIVVLPVIFEGEVMAVLELGSFQLFSDIHLTFFDQLTESIGIVLNTIAATSRTEELLKQSQSLAGELQSQQRELTETNKRLKEQAKTLQASEERLKLQQEELQRTNEELEEKAMLLARQNQEVERKNREIERARRALEEKAEQLALTSKYKSEFLANMSHELRTPLNSMLILSKLLADNQESNLEPKQIEFAQTIYSAGTELLTLINDILDLAKIESGTVEVDASEVMLSDVKSYIERTFQPVADNKALSFLIELGEDAPPTLFTDAKRLHQVLKNLLSNAFKFTREGQVRLSVRLARHDVPDTDSLTHSETVLAFEVSDTGCGIPEDKQRLIFEAFQQADGTTSRKYGGTGLGLSISREIAHLLGGELTVWSSTGEGSTFTLFMPQTYFPPMKTEKLLNIKIAALHPTIMEPVHAPALAPGGMAFPMFNQVPAEMTTQVSIQDDRDTIEPEDRVILVVEDDITFARILLDMTQERGFKGLVALNCEDALTLVRAYKPDAITLDIRLPRMDGWVLLDYLKHNAATRHIPVHILTGIENGFQRGLKMGAISYLQKPASTDQLREMFNNIQNFIERRVKSLLIVEDNDQERDSLVALVAHDDIRITAVGTGEEALVAMQEDHYDCMVLDLGLPDMHDEEFLERLLTDMEPHQVPPIVIHTGRELSYAKETALKKVAESVIIKDALSPERLLEETALFLHRNHDRMPESQRQILMHLQQSDPLLAERNILIVDDDVRNIFALTSILENYKMKIHYAENGREGIEILQNTPDIDIVLMDIMMPEMDGYETIRYIRNQPDYKTLPIIAITAKAMKGDREKCLEAGATDYITKPVNIDQLLSLFRVWLYN